MHYCQCLPKRCTSELLEDAMSMSDVFSCFSYTSSETARLLHGVKNVNAAV